MSEPGRTSDVELITSFVPRLLAHRVASGATTDDADAQNVEAAVLFADISGFTSLTERLAARGADGIEELTAVLNGYFGRLIETIHAHGGDVIKFAGDALLALFPARGAAADDLRRVTLDAARCGLAAQRAMAEHPAPEGLRLSLRVSVAAGPLWIAYLGGVLGRWELVLAGEPLAAAGAANEAAEPGDVALDPRAWELLADRCEGRPAAGESGCHVLVRAPDEPPARALAPIGELPEDALAAVARYLPGAIRPRLAAGQSAWLGERRRVTVLFINLPSLSRVESLADAQTGMRALQEAVYRFEGSVNKLSVDDKGITLIAVLGLPPLSHEDDPARGIGVALAVREQMRAHDWRCAIGVTTGQAFCGAIGSERRREYTVIGDVVNLSARLMQAAGEDGILCDRATAEGAGDRVELKALEPLAVKGKAEPVEVFRPAGALRVEQVVDDLVAHPMVAREAEVARLGAMLEALVARGEGRVAVLAGEPGIGKSRLVADVIDRARRRSVTVLIGAATSLERASPYHVWREVFRRLFGGDAAASAASDDAAAADSSRELREAIVRELGDAPELLRLAPLLGAVLPIDLPDNAHTAHMSGEVRAHNTNELLVALLARAAARAPLLVVIDDLHWLDSASWALAAGVVREVDRAMVLMTTRPMTLDRPPEHDVIMADPRTERIALRPIDAAAGLAIVRGLLGARTLPPEVEELIGDKAQGNPFFTEELAAALRDSELIVVEPDGACRLAPGVADLAAFDCPDTVQGLVTTRIDRLTAPQQLTIKVASVIGRTFGLRLLEAIHPVVDDADGTEETDLRVLTERGLTRRLAGERSRWMFKHVITQEVAYNLMPTAQRRPLHRAVAEWYETRYPGEALAPHYALLARHWTLAEVTDRALHYLERAGEQALREHANEEARGFFEEALRLAGDDPPAGPAEAFRRGRWRRALAEATYRTGRLNEALGHFDAALVALGFPFPRSAAGFAAATTIELLRQLKHRWIGVRRVADDDADARARRLEAARAYERLAQIRYLNNAKVPTLHSAFRALNLSETAGPASPELARSYANAAVCTGLLMLHGAAEAHTRRAAATAAAVGEPPCTAYVDFINGVYWATVGAWDAARGALERAVAVAEETGDFRRWDESLFTLANVLSRSGDLAGAERAAARLAASAAERDAAQAHVWGLSWRLWARLGTEGARGEVVEGAIVALGERLADPEHVGLADRILGHGLLALAHWRRGERDPARAASEAAFAIIDATEQVSHYILAAYCGLAEVQIGLWDEGEAHRRRAAQACRTLAQFGLMYPIARPRRRLYEGLRRAAAGHRWRARRQLGKSLAAARRFAMPLEEGLALRALGRAHEARAVLERIGARALLD